MTENTRTNVKDRLLLVGGALGLGALALWVALNFENISGRLPDFSPVDCSKGPSNGTLVLEGFGEDERIRVAGKQLSARGGSITIDNIGSIDNGLVINGPDGAVITNTLTNGNLHIEGTCPP